MGCVGGGWFAAISSWGCLAWRCWRTCSGQCSLCCLALGASGLAAKRFCDDWTAESAQLCSFGKMATWTRQSICCSLERGAVHRESLFVEVAYRLGNRWMVEGTLWSAYLSTVAQDDVVLYSLLIGGVRLAFCTKRHCSCTIAAEETTRDTNPLSRRSSWGVSPIHRAEPKIPGILVRAFALGRRIRTLVAEITVVLRLP